MPLFNPRSRGLAIVFLVIGSVATAAAPIPLRAGPVSMIFDADNVFLRYIRLGSDEILRGINAPIRNQNWSTVAPKVSNLRVDKRDGGFVATFDVTCAENGLDFQWKGSIVGDANGTIEFTFDGEARSTFKRNRIGFCVLHAASAAGQPWTIETVDGKASDGHFPKYISPHQPAKNLRAITHEVAPGIRARVQFEGEVFEMEDQRNWTDASFKTYCTPLDIPYPVEVAKGTKIQQKLKISLIGDLPKESPTDDKAPALVLTLKEPRSTPPRLGLQVSSEVKTLSERQIECLKALRLDHLRVDLALSTRSFVEELRAAAKQAEILGVSLHVGLNVGQSPAFEKLLEAAKELKPAVSYWLVTDADPTRFEQARSRLSPLIGHSLIGVSRTTNFVDLNRSRPTDKAIQAVGFAINPQIHAFDNASMVETLPIHADVVNSAREFIGSLPQVIGPITLRPQLVDGKVAPGGPPAGPFPTFVDTRQGSEFTAAWTLGSLKYLTDAGATSATYFETVGWNGIMDADDVGSRPAGWPSHPGELFPVYQLLREVADFEGVGARRIDSSDPLAAVGLALLKPGRMRLLVGNLSGEPRRVTLRDIKGKKLASRLLSGDVIHVEQGGEISLPPYAVARIELVEE